MPCVLSEGIVTAGISGIVVTANVTAGITSGVNFDVLAGIEEPGVGIPILPLASHIGNGAVFFTWLPSSGYPDSYEIQTSLSQDGAYFDYGRTIWPHKDSRFQSGLIRNYPMTRPLFFRIRARTANDEVSEWVQVKRGQLQKQQTTMRIRAPYQSIIEEGAKVAILDACDRWAGFKSDQEVAVE